MINYSIVMRSVNSNLIDINKAKARINEAKANKQEPAQEDLDLVATEVQNAYAIAQYSGVMTIEAFAKHISSHGCVYSRADIAAILYLAVDCMREMLLEGKKIRLGDLGDFSCSLQSKGAKDAKAFCAGNITAVNVVWDCGQEFKNLLADAEFNLVAPRKAQQAVINAIKEGNTTVDLSGSNENDDDPSTGSGTDPDPDGNGGGGSGSGSGNNTETPETPETSETVKLNTYSSPSQGGTVTAGGTYNKGTQVTIEATPNEGYLFDMWSDRVTDNPRTITLTANKSVTAWFYKEGETKPSEQEDSEQL